MLKLKIYGILTIALINLAGVIAIFLQKLDTSTVFAILIAMSILDSHFARRTIKRRRF